MYFSKNILLTILLVSLQILSYAQTDTSDFDIGEEIPLVQTVKLDHAELRKLMGSSAKTSYSTVELDSIIKMFYGQQQNYTSPLSSVDEPKPSYAVVEKVKPDSMPGHQSDSDSRAIVLSDNTTLETATQNVQKLDNNAEIIARVGEKKILISLDIIKKDTVVALVHNTKQRESQPVTLTHYEIRNTGRVQYFIQIAACHRRLSPDFIRVFYNAPYSVSEIYEEGWYKYRIYGGPTYRSAQIRKTSLRMKKVFIVPVKNGKKIDIKTAIELTDRN